MMKFKSKTVYTMAIAAIMGITTGVVAQEPIFQADFSGDSPLEGWSESKPELVVKEGPAGAPCVKFYIPPVASGGPVKEMKLISCKLDVNSIRGKVLTVGCQLKGENLVKQPQAWLGPKIQIVFKSNGKMAYHDMPMKFGTFDWTVSVFTVDIPGDVEDAYVVLGIQETSGTLWISNLSIKAAPRG